LSYIAWKIRTKKRAKAHPRFTRCFLQNSKDRPNAISPPKCFKLLLVSTLRVGQLATVADYFEDDTEGIFDEDRLARFFILAQIAIFL
jgi:hypothetical protein